MLGRILTLIVILTTVAGVIYALWQFQKRISTMLPGFSAATPAPEVTEEVEQEIVYEEPQVASVTAISLIHPVQPQEPIDWEKIQPGRFLVYQDPHRGDLLAVFNSLQSDTRCQAWIFYDSGPNSRPASLGPLLALVLFRLFRDPEDRGLASGHFKTAILQKLDEDGAEALFLQLINRAA